MNVADLHTFPNSANKIGAERETWRKTQQWLSISPFHETMKHNGNKYYHTTHSSEFQLLTNSTLYWMCHNEWITCDVPEQIKHHNDNFQRSIRGTGPSYFNILFRQSYLSILF